MTDAYAAISKGQFKIFLCHRLVGYRRQDAEARPNLSKQEGLGLLTPVDGDTDSWDRAVCSGTCTGVVRCG